MKMLLIAGMFGLATLAPTAPAAAQPVGFHDRAAVQGAYLQDVRWRGSSRGYDRGRSWRGDRHWRGRSYGRPRYNWRGDRHWRGSRHASRGGYYGRPYGYGYGYRNPYGW